MKIAIIGSGISGLAAAYFAQENGEEVHLFESANYFGGHSNTIVVNDGNTDFAVDTGFLVHNPKTYPNLLELLKILKVETYETQMTLSVQILSEGIEWGGASLATLFAQKKNLLRPGFYRMILEILRFNKGAVDFLNEANLSPKMTLGELLIKHNFSKELRDWYLVPMAAAIWSTPANKILEFPAFSFLQFCINHNLLQVEGRPSWRTIKGGSRVYVQKIIDLIPNKYLNCKIQSVKRVDGKVELVLDEKVLLFDRVVFATHADQTLNLLVDSRPEEKEILSKFSFQKNRAIVHSDTTLLPKNKSIWSAWNYTSSSSVDQVSVSYLINHLQSLPTEKPIIVTLNPHQGIESSSHIRIIEYAHPIFDYETIEAQKRIVTIQGQGGIFHCGAWQGYGFHEDGLKSAMRVAKLLNMKIPWSPIYE